MNPKAKKLVSVFFAFSLVFLSTSLYAKERRGANIIITKKDGGQISGELITVKAQSLPLQDPAGTDASVDVAEISGIQISKKSKFWKGALIGALIGLGSSALIGVTVGDWEDSVGDNVVFSVIIFAPYSVSAGALVGGVISSSKKSKFRFEGMSDSEIQKTLTKLRKKARILNFQ